MLYTGEQFATKQLKEHHENVAQGVTDRQAGRQERQAARSSTDNDEYQREARRLRNMAGMIPRQEARRQRLRSRTTRCMIEVQNDAKG